jgi:hypothetical protein
MNPDVELIGRQTLRIIELEEKVQQAERLLAESRAYQIELATKTNAANADANASEMMLRQVCDERDEAAKEVVALRELLRDCPLRLIGTPGRGMDIGAWIEKANDEVLKL